jgi:hypothetical protein
MHVLHHAPTAACLSTVALNLDSVMCILAYRMHNILLPNASQEIGSAIKVKLRYSCACDMLQCITGYEFRTTALYNWARRIMTYLGTALVQCIFVKLQLVCSGTSNRI